jgi:MFS family permease
MLISLVVQIQWLTLAPIRSAAMVYYGVSGRQIDFLSLSYMFIFLALCIPASYIIDTYGIRKGLGIGGAIAGVSGLVKGLAGGNFTVVLVCQIGLAVSQPFILNAVTALTVRWFPLKERGMAAGFAALAQYLGILLVMIVTPLLITAVYDGNVLIAATGIDRMLLIYGIATFAAACATIIFMRERPPTPPASETVKRHKFSDGIKHIMKQKNMVVLIILFFIGLGIFNAISTMIDSICNAKGFTVDQSGLVGGMMLIGGVIGAVILPILSDKFRKRKIFLIICIAGMVPGVVGLNFSGGYTAALIFSFALGFFVMSAGPIGFQYAAEVSFPAPESTSQGLILLAGQISGIVFVAGMGTPEGLKVFMIIFAVLAVAALALTFMLGESQMIITESERLRPENE